VADWTPTDEGMPPEGVVVDAIGPDDGRLRLMWKGRLWRFADGSPFLFFTPAYWRPGGGDRGAPPDATTPPA
jgi:hypothetical protein